MRIPNPRFSLLSLIVMVNVAGILVWENVKAKESWTDYGDSYIYAEQGWPLVARRTEQNEDNIHLGSWQWIASGVAVNCVIGLVLVTVTGLATDFLRTLRKQPTTPDAHS
jgi:hypothetical protein